MSSPSEGAVGYAPGRGPVSEAATARVRRATDDLAWVSWLKVIAITGVVAIHALSANAVEEGARGTVRGALAIYIDMGFKFAVPLFVMVSGALLLDPQRFVSTGHFVRKRVFRIVPPLVFWHLWYWALMQLRWSEPPSIRESAVAVMTGELYTGLYFFWIILGLALVTPVLVPFVKASPRRHVAIAAVFALAVPVLTTVTRGLRSSSTSNFDIAWVWWVPYLGVYLLGYCLRTVVLRGSVLAGASVLTALLAVLQGWQWNNAEAPALLNVLSPVSYFAPLLLVYTALVFLVVKSVVREGGLLRSLASGTPARWARTLGDATLGVFGLHLTAILVVNAYVFPVDGPAADSAAHLAFRGLATLVGTYVVVLILKRVPVVRSVL